MQNKKDIIKGIFLGIVFSFIIIFLLTSNISTLKGQTQEKYTVFKTENAGFKFFIQKGRMPKELAPLFAQTPTANSPGSQVATKEYVDSKASALAGFSAKLEPGAGPLYCDTPEKEMVISADYLGWDVGAKEDQFYGVIPLRSKPLLGDYFGNVPIFIFSQYPIGANFVDTTDKLPQSGRWLTCANIGNNPTKIIKYVGFDLEDFGYRYRNVRWTRIYHDKYEDQFLSPNIYRSIGESDWVRSLPYRRLPCDTTNARDCPDIVSGVSFRADYAIDVSNARGGSYKYVLYKRMDILSYDYNSSKVKASKTSDSYEGARNWGLRKSWNLSNAKILAVRLSGSSDDGGACGLKGFRKVTSGWLPSFNLITTHQAYATWFSISGETLEFYDRSAGPMKTCWFDIKMLKGDYYNGPASYGEYCLYAVRNDDELLSYNDWKFELYGGNADGPRGERWDCTVDILYETP